MPSSADRSVAPAVKLPELLRALLRCEHGFYGADSVAVLKQWEDIRIQLTWYLGQMLAACEALPATPRRDHQAERGMDRAGMERVVAGRCLLERTSSGRLCCSSRFGDQVSPPNASRGRWLGHVGLSRSLRGLPRRGDVDPRVPALRRLAELVAPAHGDGSSEGEGLRSPCRGPRYATSQSTHKGA